MSVYEIERGISYGYKVCPYRSVQAMITSTSCLMTKLVASVLLSTRNRSASVKSINEIKHNTDY